MCLRNSLPAISSLALLDMYRSGWPLLIAVLFLLKCIPLTIAVDAKTMDRTILPFQTHFVANLCEWIFLSFLSGSLLWNAWVIGSANTRGFSAVSCALYFITTMLVVGTLLAGSLHAKSAILQQVFLLHITAQSTIRTALLGSRGQKTAQQRY